MTRAELSTSDWRRRTYEVLERGAVADRTSRLVDGMLILLIMINIAVVILESVPAFDAAYRTAFNAVEFVSLVVFSIEYALRIWSAPSTRRIATFRRGAHAGRS
jgi:voltage-gated potassium channel